MDIRRSTFSKMKNIGGRKKINLISCNDTSPWWLEYFQRKTVISFLKFFKQSDSTQIGLKSNEVN